MSLTIPLKIKIYIGEGLTTRLLRGARTGGGNGGCCSDVGVGVGLRLRRAPVGRVVQLLLLTVSVPIAFLWARMELLLLLCGQDAAIAAAAQRYILFCLLDLLFLSLLYPLRIYLRVQLINLPLTACAALVVAVHLPINHLLVSVLGLGIEGVALASAWANLNLVPFLLAFVYVSSMAAVDAAAAGAKPARKASDSRSSSDLEKHSTREGDKLHTSP